MGVLAEVNHKIKNEMNSESSNVDLQFVGFHLQKSARRRIQSSKNDKNQAKIKVEIGSQLRQILFAC
ncbi:unnamed protein product [Cuscuta campestris]|uniref:Uncharacterized protein n=1 Tax=Cuscuta campestris TaxID=132261 RepID=A0A484MYU7_9ASTE|nr:unnamed protein product [Cuscuta campestris]